MGAVFLSLIEQLNSAVFVLILILFLAFYAWWKIACTVTRFSSIEKSSEKFEGNIDSIKDTLHSVKATVELLYKKESATVQSQSPINLTEKGIEIATAIKIREKVAEHWEDIKRYLNVATLDNPYDIQTECMDKASSIFEKFFTSEEKSEIKLYAFKIGMSLLEIYPIIAIKIRNKILEEKGIEIKDIDKHDPAKK